ncbi:MAG TPA: DUF2922 domain-containing protein [Firmicutes bacterium]|nr:DUF2922 domain-containing protein [Bacillota bacterium]
MEKTLQLVFVNEEGRNVTFSLADPLEPVDAQEVENVMDLIIAKNIFFTAGGRITEKARAVLIAREVTTIL